MAQQQNSGNLQTTLAPVQRRAKQQIAATREWFGERSTMQWIVMILIPVLLVGAITGYFLYRNRTNGRKQASKTAGRRVVRQRNVTRRTTGVRRRGRARGRRSRVGRPVATPGATT